MLDFVISNLYLCVSLISVFFFLYTYLTQRILFNVFDPILLLNLNNSIFSSVIFILFYKDYIDFESFIFYVIFIFSFYIFLFLLKLEKIEGKYPPIFKNISISNWKIVFLASSFLVFLSIICNFWFSFLMIEQGLVDTERLVLRKNNVILDLIKRDAAAVGFILQGLSLKFLGNSLKKKVTWSSITLVGMILFSLSGISSGNKALFVGGVMHLCIGYFFLSFTNPSKNIIRWIYTLLFIVCLYYSIRYLFVSDVYDKVPYAIVRLIGQADFFIHAHKEIDYKIMTGMYQEPSNYLFHSFYRVFGFQGYNLPLGSNVQAILNPGIPGGPNSPLMAVLGNLYYFNFFVAFVSSSLLAFLIVISRKFFVYSYKNTVFLLNFPLIMYFVILLPRSFQDYGTFTQQIIGVSFCYTIFILTLLIFKKFFLNRENKFFNL